MFKQQQHKVSFLTFLTITGSLAFLMIFYHKCEYRKKICFKSLSMTRLKAIKVSSKRSYPYTSLDRPQGFQEVEAPRIFRQLAHEGGKEIPGTHFFRG
jgi:hypothetical protein